MACLRIRGPPAGRGLGVLGRHSTRSAQMVEKPTGFEITLHDDATFGSHHAQWTIQAEATYPGGEYQILDSSSSGSGALDGIAMLGLTAGIEQTASGGFRSFWD